MSAWQDVAVLLAELVRASSATASTRSRLAKIDGIADLLRRAAPSEIPLAVAYLAGYLPQGSIGVGWAALRELPPPAPQARLQLRDVDAALTRLLHTTGKGSQVARRELIYALFGGCTEEEQKFLTALLTGELRQGALEGIMADAIAKAAEIPLSGVRRAAMLSGDLAPVASAALTEGARGLERFSLTIFRPLQPMLAGSAEDVEAALSRIRPAVIEWKLDGVRAQIHRSGDEVRVFTRNLADVTARVPEVVACVVALPLTSAILDAEIIALRPDRRPHRFQVTMSRFGKRIDVARALTEVPLSTFFFDILHIDGEDVLDRPLSGRLELLQELVSAGNRIPRIITASSSEAGDFLDEAIADGHEGVMIKDLRAPYEAGRRGSAWLKVKRARTLDLVVLAAEWGHGRRRGWLSNLHLGALAEDGSFVMLGKTFKGMTDEILAWQTERFLELATEQRGHTVYLRPELVVEVAFDGLQESTRYPGGLALRFARIKGYRPDKTPAEADTIATVRAIHAS